MPSAGRGWQCLSGRDPLPQQLLTWGHGGGWGAKASWYGSWPTGVGWEKRLLFWLRGGVNALPQSEHPAALARPGPPGKTPLTGPVGPGRAGPGSEGGRQEAPKSFQAGRGRNAVKHLHDRRTKKCQSDAQDCRLVIGMAPDSHPPGSQLLHGAGATQQEGPGPGTSLRCQRRGVPSVPHSEPFKKCFGQKQKCRSLRIWKPVPSAVHSPGSVSGSAGLTPPRKPPCKRAYSLPRPIPHPQT